MKAMEEKQQVLLDTFFGQEKIWWQDYYGTNIAAGIILFIGMILLIMPYQIWDNDAYQMYLHSMMLELMGMEMYLKRYAAFREDGKVKSVYETIRYLPIAHKQLVLYILKKLLKLCLCLTGAAVVCQVLFAWIFLHTFSVKNLLIPLICCLFLPMLLLGSTFLWRKC
ncbi:MAG: hypothetical protein K2M91_03870 [Lachnospiraceae bacterium]|nr:hypothetical protein [Lachnospiraceae bacterium]